MRVTERQRRFVEAYARKADGKAAAIVAGYSRAGAKTRASEQLRRPEIQRLLQVETRRRRYELAGESAFDIDPTVRARLLDYFNGDAQASRRAVERVIVAIVNQGFNRKSWSVAWAAVRASQQKPTSGEK